MKLVAGKDGMSRDIEWVHMVDTPEIAGFLAGGELAFTTGLGITDHMSLFDLVKSNYDRHGIGIVINLGPYIQTIPKEVLDFGDQKAFPIFEVQWKVHMADIMRICAYTITEQTKKETELSSAFHYAFVFPKNVDMYRQFLMMHSYRQNADYLVAEIAVWDRVENENGEYHYSPAPPIRMEIFLREAGHYAMDETIGRFVFCEANKLMLIFYDADTDNANAVVSSVREAIRYYFKNKECTVTSIGKKVSFMEDLSSSFQMAEKVERLGRYQDRTEDIISYEDLGVYQLLFMINDKNSLRDYCRKNIDVLIEYDKLHKSDLTDITRRYLECSGSIQTIADEKFIHRNTVTYRIHKAEEILSADLSIEKDRLALQMAFLVHDVLTSAEL